MAKNESISGTQEEKRQENAKKKRGAKKKLDISFLAVSNNIVFSKSEKWAYYRISNTAYDFLDDYQKISYAKRLMSGMSSLFMNRQEALECHMISTSTPVDIDLWEEQLENVTDSWNKSHRFHQYREEQASFLRQEQYMRKVTYLGVNIGKRGALDTSNLNPMELGWEGAKENLKSFASKAFQAPGYEISEQEEIDALRSEKEIGRVLSTGPLAAEPATTEELLLLIKRQLWPAMPAPYLSVDPENRVGAFDLELESASAIKKRYRWLEINQQIGEHEITGYRATLSLSKLPKTMSFPNTPPFLYIPGMISLPFTTYARFSLLPNKKMKKELYKKTQEMDDQLENMAEGGHSANLEVQEDMMEAQQLEYQLSQDNHPWVQGSYRIVVETPSLDQLKNFCSELRQEYSRLDINVNWTAGDQVDLFLEQMPGDKLRMGSFNMLTNLEMLGVSGFGISSDIGDPVWGDSDV